MEISMAYHQHKPIVCIPVKGHTSDRIRNLLTDLYLDHRRIQRLHFAKTPKEAVDLLYASIKTRFPLCLPNTIDLPATPEALPIPAQTPPSAST